MLMLSFSQPGFFSHKFSNIEVVVLTIQSLLIMKVPGSGQTNAVHLLWLCITCLEPQSPSNPQRMDNCKHEGIIK
jgi:hypothetical protein